MRYSLNQKQQLTAFLSNGEVPISNNLAENAIRPFTLDRKNWLFCDTTKGAEASAIVYSLVESAKADGVEPFAYLQHGLVELPYLGKKAIPRRIGIVHALGTLYPAGILCEEF